MEVDCNLQGRCGCAGQCECFIGFYGSNCANTIACPANAHPYEGGTCYCDAGFERTDPKDNSSACRPSTCIDPNAVRGADGACACVDGYAPERVEAGEPVCALRPLLFEPLDIQVLEDCGPVSRPALLVRSVRAPGRNLVAELALSAGPAGLLTGSPSLSLAVEAGGAGQGVLTLEPSPDRSGQQVWRVTLLDLGVPRLEVPPVRATRNVSVTVVPVNDAPSFSLALDTALLFLHRGGPGAFAAEGFALEVSPGAVDEGSQRLSFVVEQLAGPRASGAGGFAALFSSGPRLDAADPLGTLRAEANPALLGAEGSGNTSWGVRLFDSGSGANASALATFSIELLRRPRAPTALAWTQLAQPPGAVRVSWSAHSPREAMHADSVELAVEAAASGAVLWSASVSVASACGADGPGAAVSCQVQAASALPYRVAVRVRAVARNRAGASDAALTVASGLVAAPSLPGGLALSERADKCEARRTALALAWSPPADSGDGRGGAESKVVLSGFDLELTCDAGAAGQTTLELPGYSSGALLYADWAEEGRFSLWRDAGKGPEPVLAGCPRGAALEARARARNAFFASAWTAAVSLAPTALPDAVSALQAVEVPPPPGTNWTRRVPHPVSTGRAASLTWY
jgi:hypothetical protein